MRVGMVPCGCVGMHVGVGVWVGVWGCGYACVYCFDKCARAIAAVPLSESHLRATHPNLSRSPLLRSSRPSSRPGPTRLRRTGAGARRCTLARSPPPPPHSFRSLSIYLSLSFSLSLSLSRSLSLSLPPSPSTLSLSSTLPLSSRPPPSSRRSRCLSAPISLPIQPQSPFLPIQPQSPFLPIQTQSPFLPIGQPRSPFRSPFLSSLRPTPNQGRRRDPQGFHSPLPRSASRLPRRSPQKRQPGHGGEPAAPSCGLKGAWRGPPQSPGPKIEGMTPSLNDAHAPLRRDPPQSPPINHPQSITGGLIEGVIHPDRRGCGLRGAWQPRLPYPPPPPPAPPPLHTHTTTTFPFKRCRLSRSTGFSHGQQGKRSNTASRGQQGSLAVNRNHYPATLTRRPPGHTGPAPHGQQASLI